MDKLKIFCNQCGTTLWYDCVEGQLKALPTTILEAEIDEFKPESETFTQFQPAFIPTIGVKERFEGAHTGLAAMM